MSELTDTILSLLVDYDAFTGDPAEKQRIADQMIRSGITSSELEILRWYFERKATKVRLMGGIVASTLRSKSAWTDTLTVARRIYDREKSQPAPGAANLHYCPPGEADEDQGAELASQVWCFAVYETPFRRHKTAAARMAFAIEQAAERFGIDSEDVYDLLEQQRQIRGRDDEDTVEAVFAPRKKRGGIQSVPEMEAAEAKIRERRNRGVRP